jgi:signal transduction histidine kinase
LTSADVRPTTGAIPPEAEPAAPDAAPFSTGQAGRRDILLMLAGLVLLVAVGATLFWLVGRNAQFGAAVSRTLETKGEIVRLLSLAQDAETGQRGYLLTKNDRYLAPYRAATSQLEGRLARLDELIGPDDPRRGDLDGLVAVLKMKLAELSETVELQMAGKTAEALALVETDRGRGAMREIRQRVAEMTSREDLLFAEQSASLARTSNWLLGVMVFGLGVAALLAFAAQALLRRQARTLIVAQRRLEESHALLEQTNGQLAALNRDLEATVAERMADLVSANQEIQRFAYIVSHDLRAPLVNVMGFTSELDATRRTLKEQFDVLAEVAPERISEDARLAVEEDLPEAIGFIRASTSKMDRLINAILSLSREGRRVVTPEMVSPAEMIDAIAATLRQQLQAADAEIVIDPNLPTLVTDRMAIEQVFQNLVENAVKYLDRSRPGRIVVRGRRIGAYVEYAIEDNGRGIDAKDHERVFELFRRAGAQDQPGEGLGLAFVRATVRRLGGKIRLTSEAGVGSTFIMTFPPVLQPQAESRAA